MQIIEYTPAAPDLLKRLSAKLPPYNPLRYPRFVDYYFGSSDRCRLYLLVDGAGDILSVIGNETMPFTALEGPVQLGFGSNFYSFQSGAGGPVFMHWLRQCDFGLAFGGSQDMRNLLRRRRWTKYAGIDVYEINSPFSEMPGEAWWRRLAKEVLHRLRRKAPIDGRLEEMLSRDQLNVQAIPETDFSADMLPSESPFAVRFSPDVDYLNWRYNPHLDFARYRLFRILHDGVSVGYVVLNEQPRRMVVAHCDGSDAWLLAHGILASLSAVCTGRQRRCGALLATSHAVMRPVFEELGFRRTRNQRRFSIGGLSKQPSMPDDTSNWLVNLDWGDNCLRAPFLGQTCL